MDDMIPTRPYAGVLAQVRAAGLRPTRQRLALAKLLFDVGDRHVIAEQLHGDVLKARVHVSLATVYNNLHQFTHAGLLREVEAGRSYFDTNVSEHHHFYFEDDGRLQDIPSEAVILDHLPTPPRGAKIGRVDVIVRVQRAAEAAD